MSISTRRLKDIFIQDTFTADGTTTDFVLTRTPRGSSNLVWVSGVLQKDEYTLSSKTVSFTNAPTSGREILVFYVID